MTHVDTSGGSNNLSELKHSTIVTLPSPHNYVTEVASPEFDLVQPSQYQYDGSGEHSQDIQPLQPGHTEESAHMCVCVGGGGGGGGMTHPYENFGVGGCLETHTDTAHISKLWRSMTQSTIKHRHITAFHKLTCQS